MMKNYSNKIKSRDNLQYKQKSKLKCQQLDFYNTDNK